MGEVGSTAMDLSRRRFLQLASAAAASGLIVPALTPPREPYVRVGESVSFIGLALHPEPTFIGGTIVRDVLPWDGTGYPCVLYDQGPGFSPASMAARFYDTDLCNYLREVPGYAGGSKEPFVLIRPENKGRYPNLAAWVREQRYGEPVTVMLARMSRARGLAA